MTSSNGGFESREQRIAHLVLHGWELVKSTEMRGIFNPDLCIGFGVVVEIIYTRTGEVNVQSVLGEVKFLIKRRPAQWEEVTDAMLDKIEERLSQI